MNAILWGMFGGLMQELFHWYELRAKLENKKYQRLWKSKKYWIITFVMIISSGVWAYALCQDSLRSKKAIEMIYMGATFPLVWKKLIKVDKVNKSQKLGENETTELDDYFS